MLKLKLHTEEISYSPASTKLFTELSQEYGHGFMLGAKGHSSQSLMGFSLGSYALETTLDSLCELSDLFPLELSWDPKELAPHQAFRLGYAVALSYELNYECLGLRQTSRSTPGMLLIRLTRGVIFDHLREQAFALYLSGEQESPLIGQAWVLDLKNRLTKLSHAQIPMTPHPALSDLSIVRKIIEGQSRGYDTKAEYIAKIKHSQELILAGESYEVCLTNIFKGSAAIKPEALLERVLHHCPSPYAGFFKSGKYALVSASPELFLELDPLSGLLRSKPIKGTSPRFADRAMDQESAYNLKTNQKELAENLMIVDLVRHEFNQICELGSVKVPKAFGLESFSHVHQLVSEIQGQLLPGRNLAAILKACFPGGSMTGAPKRRTVEILRTIEERPRGLYSGAFGWVDFNAKGLKLAMTIRSLWMHGDHWELGVGGAITALSEPEQEYNETLIKLRPWVEILRGLGLLAALLVLGACQSGAPKSPPSIPLILSSTFDPCSEGDGLIDLSFEGSDGKVQKTKAEWVKDPDKFSANIFDPLGRAIVEFQYLSPDRARWSSRVLRLPPLHIGTEGYLFVQDEWLPIKPEELACFLKFRLPYAWKDELKMVSESNGEIELYFEGTKRWIEVVYTGVTSAQKPQVCTSIKWWRFWPFYRAKLELCMGLKPPFWAKGEGLGPYTFSYEPIHDDD